MAVIMKGIVIAKDLNIRSSASTEGDRLGSYSYGDRVEILEKDGSWGRTSKGWISLNYVYQDGTTGSKTLLLSNSPKKFCIISTS